MWSRWAGTRLRYFAGAYRRCWAGFCSGSCISRLVVANPLFLAAPSQIVQAIYALRVSGELWHATWRSAPSSSRSAMSLPACSASWLGFGMASSATAKRALQPWIVRPLCHARPSRLRRLFILWLGIGIWSKVLVVILLVLFPGDHQHRGRTAHHQRAADRDAALVRRQRRGKSSSRCRCRRRCLSSWPGLKLGIGRGLIGVVVAELFGSRAGLGRLISHRPTPSTCRSCSPAWWCWRLPASC